MVKGVYCSYGEPKSESQHSPQTSQAEGKGINEGRKIRLLLALKSSGTLVLGLLIVNI